MKKLQLDSFPASLSHRWPGWAYFSDDLRRLLLGLVVGALYWLLDATFIAAISPDHTLNAQLFNPEPAVFWQRTIAFVFIITFTVNFIALMKKREWAEVARHASEEKYRALVEGANQAIFIISADGRFLFVNPHAAEVMCSTPANITGKTVTQIYPPETADPILRHIQQALAHQHTTGEYQLGRNGRARWFELNLQPLRHADGRFLSVIGIATEITERKRNDTEIRRQNKELATLNQIIATVSSSLDLSETLDSALDAVLNLEMFGPHPKGMIFLLDEETNLLLPATHRGTAADHPCRLKPLKMGECLCGLAAQQGKPIISVSAHDDERHSRHWPMHTDHKDISLPVKAHGKVLGAMNIRFAAEQKITNWDTQLLQSVAEQIGIAVEKAKLYDATNRQSIRLRELAARAAEAEEAERKRLARELHDQVGQNLTALGINLNIIGSHLSPDSRALSCVAESQMLVEMTTDTIRTVMTDLRPPMLDDYGLVATLHWYGNQFYGRTNIPVTVHGDDTLSKNISPASANALFRITQEALNNILKHANASQVTISLTAQNSTTRLEITDNGIGFDPNTLNGAQGEHRWGHVIMAERAEAVGGALTIESTPNAGGTRVTVEITS